MELTEAMFQNQVKLDNDKLEQLSKYCSFQKEHEKNIEELEGLLKKEKEKLQKISREMIPAILNETGLSEVKLATGEKIIVEDKIQASISQKNFIQAFNNMIKAEGGNEELINNLFKTKIEVENLSDELLEYLLDQEISYSIDRKIHPQTLKKYCKERLATGKEIPEGISVFTYQETKIK